MACVGSSRILFFVSLVAFLLSSATAADPTYLFHSCPNTTTFSINSTYQTNLNRLLSTLSSNANNSFFNTTTGQGANRVYGLFHCHRDVSSSDCQDCARLATRNIIDRCPIQKRVVISYDRCLLRYSDNNIFSKMETDPAYTLVNVNYVTEPERFVQVLLSVINPAASQAASSPQRFAVAKGNFSANQPVYCLVQCTQDLSTDDCNGCLQQAIANMPKDKIGVRIIFPSCYSRYEMYTFFNESLIPTPAPPPEVDSPPPSGSVIRPRGRRGTSAGLIIAIIAPSGVFLLLCVFGYCLLSRRARRKSSNVPLRQENGKRC